MTKNIIPMIGAGLLSLNAGVYAETNDTKKTAKIQQNTDKIADEILEEIMTELEIAGMNGDVRILSKSVHVSPEGNKKLKFGMSTGKDDNIQADSVEELHKKILEQHPDAEILADDGGQSLKALKAMLGKEGLSKEQIAKMKADTKSGNADPSKAIIQSKIQIKGEDGEIIELKEGAGIGEAIKAFLNEGVVNP